MKILKPLLAVEHLTGGYSINKPVLHSISFQVYPGQMVGLIGLNGAGKSTTFKHILGLMKPREGKVTLKGKTFEEDPLSYRGTYAYVPETPFIYEDLRVMEHLELTAMARGLSKDEFMEKSAILLERFHMTKYKKQLSSNLSKGMKQKLMIINAFLSAPELYMIDEPFLGLDPLAIRSLLFMLDEVKKQGAAILMSSHILSTIERYSDRYVILDQGKVKIQGSLHDLQKDQQMPGANLDQLFDAYVLEGSGA